MKKSILIIPIIALAGCASSDKSAKEQAELYQVSMAQYQDYNCPQVKAEMNRISNLIDQQEVMLTKQPKENKNQYLDAALSAFDIYQNGGSSSSNKVSEGEFHVLSRLKSQYNGLDQLFIRKNCVTQNAN
jgi:hypothetical protein